MSTIVVVRKGGVAAIGADTLTRLGSMKRSGEYVLDSSKIVQIGDTYVGIVGNTAFGLVLRSYFAQLDAIPPLDSRLAVFEMARALHGVLKEEYFLHPEEDKEDPFESTRMDCLLANASGVYGLFCLRAVQEFSRFYAVGSGEDFAFGAMWATYPTAASAEEIARAGLEAAAEFDASTGLPIDLHTIPLTDT